MNIYHILKTLIRITKNVWITRAYIGILFVSIITYFYMQKETFPTLPNILHFEIVYLVLILSFISFLCYVYVHYSIYRALDAKISYWQTFQVTAFSRIGAYVPGKIWYATNYYIFSRQFNIGADKIGMNFVLNNALLFFTGGLCSLFAIAQLPWLAQKFLIILPLLMIVLIHPKTLSKIFPIILHKISQFSSENAAASSVDINNKLFNYSLYLKFTGFYFLLWFISGVTLFFSIRVFAPIGIQDFPVVIAASAASLIIGLLAIFAPAGLGVREGVGALILSQIISLEIAVLAFVLLRFIMVITDFVIGGIGTVAFIREKYAFEVKGVDNARS